MKTQLIEKIQEWQKVNQNGLVETFKALNKLSLEDLNVVHILNTNKNN